MKRILLFVLIITIIKSSLKEYKNEEKTILKTNIFNLDKNYLNLRKLQGSSDSTSDSVSDSTSDSTSDSVSDSVSDSTTSDSTTSDSTTSDSTTDSASGSTNSTYVELKEIIIIGFKNLQKEPFSTIDFLTYLRTINTKVPEYLDLNVLVNTKDRRLRSLENNNLKIRCDNRTKLNDTIYQYECSDDKTNGNVELIYLDSIDVQGVKKDDVDIAPLANITKTLKNGDIFTDELINTKELVMKNCEITSKDKNLIIQGNVINTDKFSPDKETYLYVVTNNNDLEKVSCKYDPIDASQKYYKLTCYPTKSFNTNLDKTLGTVNKDEHVILIFNSTDGGKVDFTANKNENRPILRRSGGLSAGGIIAIILPCIAALIAVVAVTFLLGKKTVTPPMQNLGNNTIGINSSTNAVQ